MKHALLKTAAIATSIAMIASGCGSEKKTDTNEAGKTAASGSKKEVTLKIMHFKVELADQFNKMKEEYEKTHPGVHLEFNNVISGDYDAALKAKFAGGELPDIFANGGYDTLGVWQEHLEDLSDQSWVNDLLDVAKLPITKDGKTYGLPLNLEGYGFLYNKDLFAKAGITELPKTLSQLEEASKKLQAAGIMPFVNPYQELSTLAQFLGNAVSKQQPSGTQFIQDMAAGKAKVVGNPSFEGSMKLLDLTLKYGNKTPLTTDYNNGVTQFITGQAAMIQEGNWIQPMIDKMNPGMKVGVLPMPVSEDAAFNDRIYVSPPFSFVVNKDSKVKEEAKQFLTWFATSDAGKKFIAKDFRFIPALKTVKVTEEDVGPMGADIDKYIQQGKVDAWKFYEMPNIMANIQDYVSTYQKYVGKQLNAEQVLQEIQNTWNKSLKK
ncbi:ABC transporter substrate-binding protein [Paenibacillus sp. GCM10027628]|uniref:ABC transporter substrate-binding protein n=1 Tax=Paenibacillus sp. GCM10027628 TaxID=3273413 RepID=UPI003633017F